jgi:hypothetical protein
MRKARKLPAGVATSSCASTCQITPTVPVKFGSGCGSGERHKRRDRAPLPDLERPVETRRRLEVELGTALENDLREAEVFAEVNLFAAAGGEDVDVLVDPDEHVDTVGPDPLVADLVGRALGARLVGADRRRDEVPGRAGRDADREREQSGQTHHRPQA